MTTSSSWIKKNTTYVRKKNRNSKLPMLKFKSKRRALTTFTNKSINSLSKAPLRTARFKSSKPKTTPSKRNCLTTNLTVFACKLNFLKRRYNWFKLRVKRPWSRHKDLCKKSLLDCSKQKRNYLQQLQPKPSMFTLCSLKNKESCRGATNDFLITPWPLKSSFSRRTSSWTSCRTSMLTRKTNFRLSNWKCKKKRSKRRNWRRTCRKLSRRRKQVGQLTFQWSKRSSTWSTKTTEWESKLTVQAAKSTLNSSSFHAAICSATTASKLR